jgi:hypothetical protein
MNLDDVHSLKKQISEQLTNTNALIAAVESALPFLGSGLPFAVGARLTQKEGVYKLAIRLPSRFSWVHLLRPTLKKVLKPARTELDIQVIGGLRFISAIGPVHTNPALRIGAPVRHADGDTGTLGFFAKKETKLGIVSCNHVLARFDKGKDGDDIIGPSAVELSLDGEYPLLRSNEVKVADCAFAEFKNGDQPADPARLHESNKRLRNSPFLPDKETRVMKIGSKTGTTTGKVLVKELDSFPIPVARKLTATFNDLIEIESDNPALRFSDGGDSGSLVYTEDLRPVGLLFSDTAGGGTFRNGLSFANRFEHVTSELGVTLEV